MILVDTNIPPRIARVGHSHRQPALDALALLTRRDQERFVIAPQSPYEIYVVFTRPAAANGFGFDSRKACAEVAAARGIFEVLSGTPQVYPTWEGLVAKHAIPGKQARDTRLVALMIQHRVPRILSFNDDDFRPFTGIAPLNPFDVLGVSRI